MIKIEWLDETIFDALRLGLAGAAAVTEPFPRLPWPGTLVTVELTQHAPLESHGAVTRVAYRVTAWAEDSAQREMLASVADQVMTGLGFARISAASRRAGRVQGISMQYRALLDSSGVLHGEPRTV